MLKLIDSVIDWCMLFGIVFVVAWTVYDINLVNKAYDVVEICVLQVDSTMVDASKFCNGFLNK